MKDNQKEIVINVSKNIKNFSNTTKNLTLVQNLEDGTKIDSKVFSRINFFDKVETLRIDLNLCDLNFLEKCTNLRELSIGNNDAKQQLVIDFRNLPKLKRLSLAGNFILKNSNITFLDELKIAEMKSFDFDFPSTLKTLYIRNINSFSLKEINNQINLKTLELVQINFNNLFDIDKLVDLENLSISYCKNLKNLSGIEKLKKLNNLELEKLRIDTSTISNIANLEKLLLINCGQIPSIKFINTLPKLKFFSFVDTNVLDGDLTPCLRLDFAGTLNKRHYNLKDYQLPGYIKPSKLKKVELGNGEFEYTIIDR